MDGLGVSGVAECELKCGQVEWCCRGEGTGVRLVDAGMPVTEIRWRDNRTVIIPTIYTLTHKPKGND